MDKKRKIKILFVGPSWERRVIMGGPSSVFKSLSSTLKDNEGITFFTCKENKVFCILRLIYLVCKKWDVINVHLGGYLGLIVGVIRFRSIKTYLTIHGFNPIQNSEGDRKIILSFLQTLQIKILYKNRIYVSNIIKEKVEKYLKINKGIVIYNGFDNITIDSALDKYKNKKFAKFDVFSLCGYSKTKGIHFLANIINQAAYNAKIVIAGKYKENFNFANLKYDDSSVHFKGELKYNDVILYMLNSKIYINPAEYESFGLTTLEAMYLGLPTIVSRGAGVAEILTHEENAILVDYGDIKNVIFYLNKLLNNRDYYIYISQNGKQLAEKFKANIRSQYLLKFYYKIIVNNDIMEIL